MSWLGIGLLDLVDFVTICAHATLPSRHSISFHSSWSEYGVGMYDGSNELVGCGGAVEYQLDENGQETGDTALWYLGATQCFRANAAYTLYGLKANTELDEAESSPCNSSTYINSFFTKYGLESFGNGLIDYDQYGVSSYCTAADDGGGNDDDNFWKSLQNNQLLYPNAVSYGTGCSAIGGDFVLASFTGPSCRGVGFLQTLDEMEDFNAELAALDCVRIFKASKQEMTEDDGAVEDDAAGDDAVGDDAVAQEYNAANANGGVYYLLMHSQVCSLLEYPLGCPDPHGIKAKQDQRLYNKTMSQARAVPLVMPILTAILLLGSGLLYWLTVRPRRKTVISRDVTDSSIKEAPIEHMANSFDRNASHLAYRTRTFTEQLMQYAQEMEEEEEDGTLTPMEPSDYKPPPTDHGSNQISVADAVLAEKGLPTTAGTSKKKFKRPVMAKVSRLFRRGGKKTKTRTVEE